MLVKIPEKTFKGININDIYLPAKIVEFCIDHNIYYYRIYYDSNLKYYELKVDEYHSHYHKSNAYLYMDEEEALLFSLMFGDLNE